MGRNISILGLVWDRLSFSIMLVTGGRTLLRHGWRAAWPVATPAPLRAFSAVPMQDQIKSLVQADKVVVFMKGVPEQPRCGFSNAVVQIMRMHDVEFKAHDVLQNEDLRQGIKEYSSWPTIPQIYMQGEFVGGCDIFLQMHQNGELVEELGKIGIKSALLDSETTDK